MEWASTKERLEKGQVRFNGAVVGIAGQVQAATGLRLKEGLGWPVGGDVKAKSVERIKGEGAGDS
jgi:hypothetical protein